MDARNDVRSNQGESDNDVITHVVLKKIAKMRDYMREITYQCALDKTLNI